MRKIISIIFVGILVCGLSLKASAVERVDSVVDEDKVEELVSRGFPQGVIETMDDAMIDKIYQKIQDDDIVNITSNQETYFIEFPSDKTGGIQTKGAIETSKLKIVADIMNYADVSEKITGCDISLNYEWIVTPGTCSTDAITLGWDPGVFTYSGYMSGHNKVHNMGTGEEDYYNFISAASLANTGGIGWYAELMSPNISPKVQSNPSGSAYVSFIPAKVFYSNSGITSNFQIQYVHNKLGLSIGLSYGAVGVSVDCLGGTDTAAKTMVYRANVVNN